MIRSELWRGLRVIWRHTPRGGYGYTLRIPVTVVAIGARRARVRIEATGETVSVSFVKLADANMRLEGSRSEPPARVVP